MIDRHVWRQFADILAHYNTIQQPRYRYINLNDFKEKYRALLALKEAMGDEPEFTKLVNAMSQIIAKREKIDSAKSQATDNEWTNYSERGVNKAIPPILKRKGQTWPIELTDKWGNSCSIDKGYWGAKNYTVMDAISYMFIMKEGGDAMPVNSTPLFNDIYEIELLENQLNGVGGNILTAGPTHKIRFTDDDFRQHTKLKMSSTEIHDLLLDTSRVEFKLAFPVRLKSTGAKENTHRMNYYSRFFELGYEDLRVKSNGVVLSRRYTVIFNTLLGGLFVNNLLAKFNDKIDARFYQLPDSAQIFYRRALLHHNFACSTFYLTTIAEYTGLVDRNPTNLAATVENSILNPLIEQGYIDGYEKNGGDARNPKYIIKRSGPDIRKISNGEG